MFAGGGYLRLGRFRGAPVRLHWSAALGAVVFGRFQFVPAFWSCFLVLVILHEMGHATLVRRFRARPLSLDVHALGGLCRWEGEVTRRQRALIAWGGVFAQALAFVVAEAALALCGPPRTAATREIAWAFTESNLWLIALNLIPVPPLDGAAAWPLAGMLYRDLGRLRRERAQARRARATASSRRQLRALDAMEDAAEPATSDAPDLEEVKKKISSLAASPPARR
jgi:Zn-dependent protease